MNKYSEEIRFMCKYKISTLADSERVKDEKNDLRSLDNERNRLYYKRGKLIDDKEKDDISKEIIKVTDKIKKVKEELGYCADVANISREKTEDIRYVEEKRWREKGKNKKKDIRENSWY